MITESELHERLTAEARRLPALGVSLDDVVRVGNRRVVQQRFVRVVSTVLLSLGIAAALIPQVGLLPRIESYLRAQTGQSGSAVELVLPLVFPDGRRIEIVYPEELALDQMTVRASIRGRVTSGLWQGCGALVEVVRDAAEFNLVGEPERFTGSNGEIVELWPSSGPAAHVLLFDFGAWKAGIPFSSDDGCPPQDLAPIWAGAVIGTVQEDFLLVEFQPPARLDSANAQSEGLPSLSLGNGTDHITLLNTDCGAIERPSLERFDGGATWCIAEQAVELQVEGIPDFVDAVIERVKIRHPSV